MTPEQITDDRLVELADAASQGQREAWSSIYEGMKAAVVIPSRDPLVTIAEVRTDYADALFLAACDPQRVKALVREKQSAEAALREALEALREAKTVLDQAAAAGRKIGPLYSHALAASHKIAAILSQHEDRSLSGKVVTR